jgi:hypothetical protein
MASAPGQGPVSAVAGISSLDPGQLRVAQVKATMDALDMMCAQQAAHDADADLARRRLVAELRLFADDGLNAGRGRLGPQAAASSCLRNIQQGLTQQIVAAAQLGMDRGLAWRAAMLRAIEHIPDPAVLARVRSALAVAPNPDTGRDKQSTAA